MEVVIRFSADLTALQRWWDKMAIGLNSLPKKPKAVLAEWGMLFIAPLMPMIFSAIKTASVEELLLMEGARLRHQLLRSHRWMQQTAEAMPFRWMLAMELKTMVDLGITEPPEDVEPVGTLTQVPITMRPVELLRDLPVTEESRVRAMEM